MPADAAPPESGTDAAVRAAQARARSAARLTGMIDDLFLADDARLTERSRLAVARLLTETVGGIESELRRQASRMLTAKGATAAAQSLLAGHDAAARLTRAGVLRDEALIEALVARVQQAELGAALPLATGGSDEASLLVRLAGVPDRVVATAARALLAADSAGPVLPADLQRRLVWWVAAAIRPPFDDADADRAIAEAAMRSLGAHDESESAEAVAMRLAAAIDARPDELAPLLLEALGDRRLSLFVAVIAQAVGLDFAQAQALVLEPEGERLWLALRAVRLDRSTIARIALALSDADPRRDIEAFADDIDRIAGVAPEVARHALAPETLTREYRGAIRVLARSERR